MNVVAALAVIAFVVFMGRTVATWRARSRPAAERVTVNA
jgi:uncharacterized membrane protein